MLLKSFNPQIQDGPARNFRVSRFRTAVVTLIAALGLMIPVHPAHAANTVQVSGTAQATSAAGASIAVGDSFSWSFTLNLDSTATGGSTFNNAVTAFTMSADSGNVGTWTPAGVSWVISPVFNLVTNAGSDQLTLQVQAASAPPINGVGFLDVVITLDWPAGVVDVQPVTGSPSLGTTLGTFSPDFQAASYYYELRDTNYSSASFVAPAVQTPSNTTPLNSPSTQVFDLLLETSDGGNCSASLISGSYGAWVQLPVSDICTPPTDLGALTLLGWSTNLNFPRQVAQEQAHSGWGAIDAEYGGQRMIFMPAGAYTLMSGNNQLYAIWG